MRVPWTARRFNQSILKEIHPEYSLEGLMLKLKLQYFGHLISIRQIHIKCGFLFFVGGHARHTARRILGIELVLSTVEVRRPNHWTTRESPKCGFLVLEEPGAQGPPARQR